MANPATPRIVNRPDAEVPTEILAESIVAISQGLRKLRAGRMNDRALVLLIQSTSGCSQKEVKAVLYGIDALESAFIRKPGK